MEKLHFLIQALTKPQWKILKVHLKYLSVRKDSHSQMLKLAEILLRSDHAPPSLEECSILIYGKMNYAAIQKIKSRLLQRIKSLLVFDVGMEKRSSQQEDLDRYGVTIRWETTLYQILYNRTGNSPVLRNTMDGIIRLCREYEYYPTLVEILNNKKWMTGYRQGETVMAKINEEVSFYKRCNDALTKAKDYYFLSVVRSNFTTKDDRIAFQKFLIDSIAELNEDYNEVKSPFVAYFIKHLEIMYYKSGDNLGVTREVCRELINIVRDHKSVFSKQRLAVVYGTIAVCDLKLGDEYLAIENAQAAQKYCLRNSENYFAAIEYEFIARFYLRELDKCKVICSNLIKSTRKEMGDFRYAKYLFYQANLFYLQGRFKEGLTLLNFKLELSRDKLGWDISIRILRIQLLLELGRMDEASSHFESLSKHVSRSNITDTIRPRDKVILRILRLLNNEGFSLNRIRTKIEQYCSMLTHEKDLSYEPLSSEMIPFHHWLESHYKLNHNKKVTELV